MTAAERLVNRIREFVNGFEPEMSPEVQELARQFLEDCRSLNERLAKCRDFLRQGMRSEAVQEAQARPSVFELAEALSFPERKKWQSLCLEHGLSPAQKIDLEAVEKLKEECGKEQLLEPLLHEFRRLVHAGTRDQRINILRRIRRHDPENPVWVENLEPLEYEQLEELQERVEQAMNEENEEQVSAILADLTSTHRVVEAPAQTIREIEAWLRQRRQRAAAEEGSRICAELKEKLEERDLHGMAEPLAAWERLAKFPDFIPEPEMREIADKAENWHRGETNRRRRERQFNQSLEEMRLLLHSPRVQLADLEAKWRQLHGFNRELPEDLRQNYQAALAQLQEQARRQRRQRIMVGTAVAATLLLALTIGSWMARRHHRIKQTRQTITTLWSQQRDRELAQYLQELERNPRLSQAAEAGLYRQRVEERLQQEHRRLQELEDLLAQLQEIRNAQYEMPAEKIAARLAKARQLAVTEQEKSTLDNWEQTWQSWQRRQQEQRERAFVRAMNELADTLRRIEEGRHRPLDARLEQVAEWRGQFRQLQEQTVELSSAVRAGMGELQERANSLQAELEEARRQEEEAQRQYEQLLARIPRTAGRLDEWAAAIKEFLERFPDANIATPLRQALQQETIARDALALTPFSLSSLPTTDTEIDEIERRLGRLPAGRGSVWRKELETIMANQVLRRRMKEQLQELPKLEFYNWQRVGVRQKDETEWRTYYIPDTFYRRDFEEDNGPVTRYWGRVHGLAPDSLSDETEHLSVTSETHEVEFSPRESDNLTPAARYIRLFMLRLPEDHELRAFLLSEMNELRHDQELALLPKAKIMSIIGDAIAQTCMSQHGVLEKYRNIFAGINLDIPWYNHQHPLVASTQQRVAERIEQLPTSDTVTARLEFKRHLLLTSLNRNLECVGLLWPDEEKETLQPRLRRSGLNTVWALRLRPGATPAYQFFEMSIENNQLNLPRNQRWIAGQLLFAPADNQTSEEILRALKPPKNLTTVDWPDSWPINTRSLP